MTENYIDTALGALRGQQQDDLAIFAGVPFAAPPIGELRFAAPQQAAAWHGVRDAVSYGSAGHWPDEDNVRPMAWRAPSSREIPCAAVSTASPRRRGCAPFSGSRTPSAATTESSSP